MTLSIKNYIKRDTLKELLTAYVKGVELLNPNEDKSTVLARVSAIVNYANPSLNVNLGKFLADDTAELTETKTLRELVDEVSHSYINELTSNSKTGEFTIRYNSVYCMKIGVQYDRETSTALVYINGEPYKEKLAMDFFEYVSTELAEAWETRGLQAIPFFEKEDTDEVGE